MHPIIAIALGGSAGAITRFLVANGIYTTLGRDFPHATLFINVSGSFLMGFLTELLLQRFALALEYRAAILVGFLGAYTTFSTFALETIYLFENGSIFKAVLNVVLSAGLCLLACWVGLLWGRSLFADDIYPGLTYKLPYFQQFLGLILLFLLAVPAELLFQRFNTENPMRYGFFIVLLGGFTITSALWLTFKPSEISFELLGLLSFFAINTVLGVVMVWFGSSLGQWIWQLKLLR
jgi:CrcB protein